MIKYLIEISKDKKYLIHEVEVKVDDQKTSYHQYCSRRSEEMLQVIQPKEYDNICYLDFHFESSLESAIAKCYRYIYKDYLLKYTKGNLTPLPFEETLNQSVQDFSKLVKIKLLDNKEIKLY